MQRRMAEINSIHLFTPLLHLLLCLSFPISGKGVYWQMFKRKTVFLKMSQKLSDTCHSQFARMRVPEQIFAAIK